MSLFSGFASNCNHFVLLCSRLVSLRIHYVTRSDFGPLLVVLSLCCSFRIPLYFLPCCPLRAFSFCVSDNIDGFKFRGRFVFIVTTPQTHTHIYIYINTEKHTDIDSPYNLHVHIFAPCSVSQLTTGPARQVCCVEIVTKPGEWLRWMSWLSSSNPPATVERTRSFYATTF